MRNAADRRVKSSFAVVGEQRVVVLGQLTRTETFLSKDTDSCSTLTLSKKVYPRNFYISTCDSSYECTCTFSRYVSFHFVMHCKNRKNAVYVYIISMYKFIEKKYFGNRFSEQKSFLDSDIRKQIIFIA